MTRTVQSCALIFLPTLSHEAQHLLNTGGGQQEAPAQLNLMVCITQKIVPSHLLHSHSKVQVKLHHFSLLYIYNHSLQENPGEAPGDCQIHLRPF